MIWTDDPVRDYDRYCTEQERLSERLPVCEGCGERIYDEFYWEFSMGECYCDNCAKKYFRKINVEV